MIAICEKCRFWEQVGPTENDKVDITGFGECHRRAPLLFAAFGHDTDKNGETHSVVGVDVPVHTLIACHPLTRASDWCGEFEPRPLSVTA